MQWRRVFIFSIGVLAVADTILLLSGERVLVRETLVTQLDQMMDPNHAHIPGEELPQDTLICSYWTGRAILKAEFHFESNNIFGRDSCPFVYAPE